MIDVHCHLEYIKNPEKVILEAQRRGMKALISSLADPQEIKKILKLKEKYPNFLYLSFGFHPDSSKKYKEREILNYLEFIKKNKEKTIAIGEIGLDYFHQIEPSERELTKKIFKIFLDLANEINLPVIIHCRQAFEDLMEILKEKKTKKVVLHCFSGSEGDLKEALKRDYFISFATNICYTKKHPRLVQKTPIEKIFLETDSPWLDPNSPQTLTNRPWNIEKSAKIIAKIKNKRPKEILEITTQNTINFFNLKIKK